jgi:hypothetical protein
MADEVFVSWAQGFMSGANSQRLMHNEDAINVGSEQYPAGDQTRFLHSYCEQHPDAVFTTAAIALYQDIAGQVKHIAPSKD